MPRSASAQSTLTWARVELTRNQVQLFTNGQGRRARVSDVLGVGDALSTARRARAELRFNDGSLARIGESAVFQFTPDTRNFRLSNGTVLLLVPPGQGRTTIQTPNAVTGIHGSALFVRFIPETDTTIIGALTNNADGPMMAFNQDGTQQQPLYAGEMAVLRGNRILERFDFELETFYETSDLVVGLQLEDLDTETGDQAIDAVRQEIQDALEQQERFDNNSEIIDNPSFISANQLSANRGEPLDSTTAVPEFAASPAATFLQQNGIDEGFTSAVSGTIHRPTGDQVPTATGQPNPQPSVAKPPTPAPQPTVVKPPTPTPAPAPTQPIAPTPAPAPAEPIPGELPGQPVEKPPTPVIPEANIVVEPVESLAPIVQPEPTVPAPVTVPEPAPSPVVVVTPEPTVIAPTEVIAPPPEKPIVPVEAVTLPPTAPEAIIAPTEEVVIPPAETINVLEDVVPEPAETEVQVERLTDNVIVTETIEEPPSEVTPTMSEEGNAPPPGQVGATPGQSGAPPPGQVGATPGQSGN